jgi:hypothetical protein
MPVNCESWSIQATLSSASAANVHCWAYPDRRITTGRHRCGNRRCGSWPGSMLSIWTIRAAVAAGWPPTWPEKASRSAAIGCESSCAAWGYGRSTRNPARPCQASHPSDFPAWWTSSKSGQRTRSGRPISPTSRCREDSSTWWQSWICSPETYSAGSCQTALTRNSVCKHWRWPSVVAVSRRSSTLIKDASSPLLTSWPGCGKRQSRSAGQVESAATTTSWWRDCGEPSNMRRCICMPTTMAGRLKSTWPASFGGTAM